MNPSEGPHDRATIDRGRWPRPSWPALVALGLLTRVAVVALGCLMARPEADRPTPGAFSPVVHAMYSHHHDTLSAGRWRWIEPWYRWDATFYAEVSRTGYIYRPDNRSTVAFFPLLPLLMAAGSGLGLDRYWVGLVLPNLAFSLGFALFGKVVLRVTDDVATTWRACLLLVAYPWSLFFSAPYQESFGFALTAAALLAWSARQPLLAALALAGATTARLGVISLSLAILVEWANDLVRGRAPRPWAWFVAASGAIGIGCFYAYLYLRFGDPLVQVKVQADWGRRPARIAHAFELLGSLADHCRRSWPFALTAVALLIWMGHRPLWSVLIRAGATPAQWASRYPTWLDAIGANLLLWAFYLLGETLLDFSDLYAMASFLILGMHAWRRRGPFWGISVLFPVFLPMATGSTMSLARLVLAAFPAFIDAAELAPRGRITFAVSVAGGLVVQVILIDRYVNWGFAG